MSQTYMARRRAQDAPAEQKFETSVPGPSMQELAAGAMPSTEQMGRRVDLPDAIREKMEASFGADFSGVKLYESQTVADAGAQAMTMGSNVAFAPGQLDLASTSGQALLGHELSHVVSQARGESAGRGFLADSGLEAQADRQGMLAAQGESAYSGPVAPLSSSAVPTAAAGPMQAAKLSGAEKSRAEEYAEWKGQELPSAFWHPFKRDRALRQALADSDDDMMFDMRHHYDENGEFIGMEDDRRQAMVSAGAAETNASLLQRQAGMSQAMSFEDVAANGLRRDTSGSHEASKKMYDMYRRVIGGADAVNRIVNSSTRGGQFNNAAALSQLTALVNNSGIRKYLVQQGRESFRNLNANLTPEQKSALIMSDFQNRVIGGTFTDELTRINKDKADQMEASGGNYDPALDEQLRDARIRSGYMAKLTRYDIKTGRSTASQDPQQQAMYDAYLQMLADDFRDD